MLDFSDDIYVHVQCTCTLDHGEVNQCTSTVSWAATTLNSWQSRILHFCCSRTSTVLCAARALQMESGKNSASPCAFSAWHLMLLVLKPNPQVCEHCKQHHNASESKKIKHLRHKMQEKLTQKRASNTWKGYETVLVVVLVSCVTFLYLWPRGNVPCDVCEAGTGWACLFCSWFQAGITVTRA